MRAVQSVVMRRQRTVSVMPRVNERQQQPEVLIVKNIAQVMLVTAFWRKNLLGKVPPIPKCQKRVMNLQPKQRTALVNRRTRGFQHRRKQYVIGWRKPESELLVRHH